jgi:hypothetical protein
MPNGFCHVELNTDELGQAKKFYKSLFDWKLGDMGGYTMIDVGKGGVGGGMQKKPMAGSPTMWLPYVMVDDVKKTVAKAKKLGAEVHVEYMEIGNGMGSIGVFTDPTGAPIGVWATGKPAAKDASAKKASAKKTAKKTAAKKR